MKVTLDLDLAGYTDTELLNCVNQGLITEEEYNQEMAQRYSPVSQPKTDSE